MAVRFFCGQGKQTRSLNLSFKTHISLVRPVNLGEDSGLSDHFALTALVPAQENEKEQVATQLLLITLSSDTGEHSLAAQGCFV